MRRNGQPALSGLILYFLLTFTFCVSAPRVCALASRREPDAEVLQVLRPILFLAFGKSVKVAR